MNGRGHNLERHTESDYLISVIIPIYNREALIDKTVLSVLNQPCGDKLEIILVNDGSTDNSQQICEEYANNHLNIRVINKPNGGVASARNKGIDEATGKYVAFLDCDDWWNEGFFDDVIAKELENSDIDIYGFSYYVTNSNCKYIKAFRVPEKEEHYNKNELGRFNWFSHCSLLFSKTFLYKNNGLKYPDTKLCEDLCFGERCFFLAKSYKTIDKSIFTYWVNSNSTVHTVDCEVLFSEDYEAFLLNKAWFNSRGQKYDIEYGVCMLFCTYIESLCCKYTYKKVKEIIDNDKRLQPVWEYKKWNLALSYYKVIEKWMLYPFRYYLKCRLLKRPVFLMRNALLKQKGFVRDIFEFINYRIIRHYEYQ